MTKYNNVETVTPLGPYNSGLTVYCVTYVGLCGIDSVRALISPVIMIGRYIAHTNNR